MPLLFPQQSLQDELNNEGIFKLETGNLKQQQCCTVEAVERFILHADMQLDIKGCWLQTVLSHLMIQCTLSSYISFNSPQSIGADIPPVQHKVFNVQLTTPKEAMYKDLSAVYK